MFCRRWVVILQFFLKSTCLDGLLFDFPLYIDVNDNAVIALNKKRTYQRVLCKKAIFEKAQGGFSSDLSIELEDRFSGFSARIYNVEIYDTIKTYAKSGFNSLIYIVVGVGAFFVFSLLVSLSACLYFYYSKTNSRANAVVIKPSKPQISKKDSSNTVSVFCGFEIYRFRFNCHSKMN